MARLLRLLLVNAVVFAVLAEWAGLLAHYLDTGRLFYVEDRPAAPAAEAPASRTLTADAVHPYFGPLHRPGVRRESNNVGFTSPYPFPYVPAGSGEVILGIFGGSVGELFCQQGAPRLIARLSAHPDFRARRIVPLCFSHEGYKQPQQLIVLAYFLAVGQRFDLVLNIDGFNEVALSTYNRDRGRDISMPSPLHLDPLIDIIDQSTLTPEKIEALAEISRQQQTLDRWERRRARNRSAAVEFVLGRLLQWRRQRFRAEAARYAGLPAAPAAASLIEVTRPLPRPGSSTLYEDVAADWASASQAMSSLLAARSIRYLHVLQPNQYFGARRFSDEEAAVALNEETPFKPPVEQGYPILLRAAKGLQEHVPFLDATRVFDAESAPMYADDCCHYTERGNELLADVIAERLLADRGGPPRAR